MSVGFSRYGKGMSRRALYTVHDLSVTVEAGEIVAVVGASGSGKSLLAHAVMGILPRNAFCSGEVLFRGALLDERLLKKIRGKELTLVPQGASHLDPLMKVGNQLRKGRRGAEAQMLSRETLAQYHLGAEIQALYPFELSGGMSRRVLISTATMERPALILADEPTPGLHRQAARQVLSHFRELADGGAGVLLITHDLEAALEVSDRVTVLYGGTALEETGAENFRSEETVYHPYTKALLRALPQNGFQPWDFVPNTEGGCPFAQNCGRASALCREKTPSYQRTGVGHVRCHAAEWSSEEGCENAGSQRAHL